MGTDAAGLVGGLELDAPDVPSRPVSVLEDPSDTVVKPPVVSVLPPAVLPVLGTAGVVVVLPVAGVEDPAGVLVELPTSLPLADSLTPAADGSGPAPAVPDVDDGSAGALLARLTEAGWVLEGTRAACLTAGCDGAGGVAGWAGAAAAVAEM
jgi:hypothetical protein